MRRKKKRKTAEAVSGGGLLPVSEGRREYTRLVEAAVEEGRDQAAAIRAAAIRAAAIRAAEEEARRYPEGKEHAF